METQNEVIRLTQYSHGAGCGCKIAPSVLQEILRTDSPQPFDSNLLVGNSSNDDAAAYDLGNGTALISTTDFFMPIVDDPFDFGRIAAANGHWKYSSISLEWRTWDPLARGEIPLSLIDIRPSPCSPSGM